MHKKKTVVYVLVGLPGSGKSHWISKQNMSDAFVYSTDDYIEQVAAQRGLSYDDVWASSHKEAYTSMEQQLSQAIANSQDVIWDQTNMSAKKRRRILAHFPKNYIKKCICFVPPETEQQWTALYARLDNRPGKTIPRETIASMNDSFDHPSFEEGFDGITYLEAEAYGLV